ncbi:hypothetical protein QF035_004217 [Streptomyces umbrinus]|uniref:Uncharacterized protein n=1 Tax=Streptomyces umbrinus TaxID=67370 RepID=A0ABU0SSX1_9ACTN|nr:hypothetical protein [Streptomyces umbrinus]MDQ1026635.1 hypothetical protein [Streptomyces umbrinus]
MHTSLAPHIPPFHREDPGHDPDLTLSLPLPEFEASSMVQWAQSGAVGYRKQHGRRA